MNHVCTQIQRCEASVRLRISQCENIGVKSVNLMYIWFVKIQFEEILFQFVGAFSKETE